MRIIGFALAMFLSDIATMAAEPLTFNFSGTITFVHELLDLGDSVFVGAPIGGSYVFDPTGVVDANPENPQIGSYYFGSAGRMWALIGNYEFTTPDLGLLILNDRLGRDLYQPISFAVSSTAGYDWGGMFLFLSDETGSALDSDALPLGVPVLNDFPSERSFGILFPWNEVAIRGTLTSLTPEPGSLALFALGSVGLCRRKKSR